MSEQKERVLAAIHRDVPDRVPLDFSANAGVQEMLYRKLPVSDYYEMLCYFHSDIFDMRGVIDPQYNGSKPFKTRHPDGIFENYWGMKTRIMNTATGPEESYCEFPLADFTDIEQFERYSWPCVDDFDFSTISSRLKRWKEFAIMASGVSIFQHPTFLRGLDNLLVDFLINPEIADYIMDKFTDFYLAYYDRLLSAADGQITILRIADDLGMQDRLLISPEIFSRFFIHRLEKFADMAHSHGVYVMNHSCGSIVPFIPKLIDIGVDILDPIQITAKGMDPVILKEQFGNDICFHGGVDTQYLLPEGSPEEVRKQVGILVDTLGCNGGYILSPSHILQTDVPLENIEALYQEGQNCRYH
ncbi:MAG: uroporphyrinogen decarboxylase family protein [Sphaerochaetaceae bacterium]